MDELFSLNLISSGPGVIAGNSEHQFISPHFPHKKNTAATSGAYDPYLKPEAIEKMDV